MVRTLPKSLTLLFSLTILVSAWAAGAAKPKKSSISMQVTTSSPAARAEFETGLAKWQTLHETEGLEHFRKAAAADQKFALAHIFLANFSTDPTEQVAEMDRALATRKNASKEEQVVIDWLGYSLKGNWVPAIQSMNTALEQWPQHRELQWLAGVWLTNQQQFPRAIAVYEKLMKSDPEFADPWNSVAYCYARTWQFEKAFAAMKRYTELLPTEPNPQDSFAEISRMAGKYDDALLHYHASLKIDPGFIESELGIADTYALIGDEAGARAQYDMVIKKADKARSVLWSLQRAATFVRENDFAGADAAYTSVAQKAHESGFGNMEAEAYRSMAMYQTDPKKANQSLEQALAALDEDHPVSKQLRDAERSAVLRGRVTTLAHAGDFDGAATALKQLQDLSESANDGNIELNYHSAQGTLLLAQGKTDEAVSMLREDDRNPVSLRELFAAYEKAGNKAEAERVSKEIARFNEPIVEQAMVVPSFRKDHSVVASK